MSTQPFEFLTVTYSGDIEHFALLRCSLQQSNLSHIRHHVVVQDEDLPKFQQFSGDVALYSSADILPKQVESMRRIALQRRAQVGRRATKLLGSLSREIGWPRWVRYTGWHTQQIIKLAFTAACETRNVVVLDSDVLLTPFAREQDFVSNHGVVCYQDWRDTKELRGKVKRWRETAFRLFDQPLERQEQYDAYYDTPFVLHSPSVKDLCDWLQEKYQSPWWAVLMNLPPRRWSEFGIYKQFLRQFGVYPVQWRSPEHFVCIYDAADARVVVDKFDYFLNQKNAHSITIHSQNSGRGRASRYQKAVREQFFRDGRCL